MCRNLKYWSALRSCYFNSFAFYNLNHLRKHTINYKIRISLRKIRSVKISKQLVNQCCVLKDSGIQREFLVRLRDVFKEKLLKYLIIQ